MNLKRIFLPLFLLALLTASCDQGVSKLVFAVDTRLPPMEFLDDSGQPAGFDIDLVRKLAEAGGFRAEFLSVAWADLFSGLEAGRYDAVISSVVINETRASKYDFTQPYLNAGQVLVVPLQSRAGRLADLRGQVVGALTGTPGAAVAAQTPGVTLKSFDVIERAFAELATGRLAGVVTETPVAALYAFQLPRYRDSFKIVGQPLSDENYGLVVKKGNRRVLDALNAALEKVKASESLAELATRWLR